MKTLFQELRLHILALMVLSTSLGWAVSTKSIYVVGITGIVLVATAIHTGMAIDEYTERMVGAHLTRGLIAVLEQFGYGAYRRVLDSYLRGGALSPAQLIQVFAAADAITARRRSVPPPPVQPFFEERSGTREAPKWLRDLQATDLDDPFQQAVVGTPEPTKALRVTRVPGPYAVPPPLPQKRDELTERIEASRAHVMTAEEREEQRRSFAHGNVSLSNPAVTRETIDKAAESLEWSRRRSDAT